MSRAVPYDPEAICDICGALGAYDFMGDVICVLCLPKEDAVLDDYDPELDYDLDDEEWGDDE